jgi:hypothetical protein
MAGSLIRPAGLDWRVPHSSTLPRRRKDLVVAIPCRRPRGGPPHPVVDGTGPKVPGEGERKVRRHGAETRRARREVHLGVDADGREVRAVEVTDHRRGDGEIVPGLLARLPEAERIAVISGDGAHDTRAVCEASISREADSVVPPRRNGKPWEARTAGAGERNEALRAVRRLGRRLRKGVGAQIRAVDFAEAGAGSRGSAPDVWTIDAPQGQRGAPSQDPPGALSGDQLAGVRRGAPAAR